jgi:hypothetical protein
MTTEKPTSRCIQLPEKGTDGYDQAAKSENDSHEEFWWHFILHNRYWDRTVACVRLLLA